jgi:hypothetical protein
MEDEIPAAGISLRHRYDDDAAQFFSIDRPDRASIFYHACQNAIDGIRAHGNRSILLVNFIFTFMEMIREQKQQIG